MDRTSPDDAISLRAYPNISSAAKIVGVAASTLSRRDDLVTESRGDRDQVLSPAEVLRLAAIYRERSLNDVAEDLIGHASGQAPEDVRSVEEAVEAFFEQRVLSAAKQAEFLGQAERLLPPRLYEEVAKVVEETAEDPPAELDGSPPMPE